MYTHTHATFYICLRLEEREEEEKEKEEKDMRGIRGKREKKARQFGAKEIGDGERERESAIFC